MTSPQEIMREWPHYRVASQKGPNDDMQIRTIRCKNVTELYDFLKRIYTVSKLEELSFLEVHQMLPGGRIALVHESPKPWPRKVKEIKIDGILSPRIPREEKDKVTAVVEDLTAKATTVIAGDFGPDEESRPTIPYTIEVA